jgi:hypothetical protein
VIGHRSVKDNIFTGSSSSVARADVQYHKSIWSRLSIGQRLFVPMISHPTPCKIPSHTNIKRKLNSGPLPNRPNPIRRNRARSFPGISWKSTFSGSPEAFGEPPPTLGRKQVARPTRACRNLKPPKSFLLPHQKKHRRGFRSLTNILRL